ncbi:MAG: hypothetical protein NC924_09490 [Candidatus Omnitrophica bacterium]|nr:hypothetical protein [Candidatus Omnitrophota bacterium]
MKVRMWQRMVSVVGILGLLGVAFVTAPAQAADVSLVPSLQKAVVDNVALPAAVTDADARNKLTNLLAALTVRQNTQSDEATGAAIADLTLFLNQNPSATKQKILDTTQNVLRDNKLNDLLTQLETAIKNAPAIGNYTDAEGNFVSGELLRLQTRARELGRLLTPETDAVDLAAVNQLIEDRQTTINVARANATITEDEFNEEQALINDVKEGLKNGSIQVRVVPAVVEGSERFSLDHVTQEDGKTVLNITAQRLSPEQRHNEKKVAEQALFHELKEAKTTQAAGINQNYPDDHRDIIKKESALYSADQQDAVRAANRATIEAQLTMAAPNLVRASIDVRLMTEEQLRAIFTDAALEAMANEELTLEQLKQLRDTDIRKLAHLVEGQQVDRRNALIANRKAYINAMAKRDLVAQIQNELKTAIDNKVQPNIAAVDLASLKGNALDLLAVFAEALAGLDGEQRTILLQRIKNSEIVSPFQVINAGENGMLDGFDGTVKQFFVAQGLDADFIQVVNGNEQQLVNANIDRNKISVIFMQSKELAQLFLAGVEDVLYVPLSADTLEKMTSADAQEIYNFSNIAAIALNRNTQAMGTFMLKNGETLASKLNQSLAAEKITAENSAIWRASFQRRGSLVEAAKQA